MVPTERMAPTEHLRPHPAEQPVRAAATPLPALLSITPWWDPELALSGFDPLGAYVERFWLPILGPASTLMLRGLARGLADNPTGFSVAVDDLARSLGIGTARSRNAPAPRSIERLTYFGMIRHVGGSLAVRTHVPAVGPHLVRRLPDALRHTHPAWLLRHGNADGPPPPGRSGPVAS